jgi:hypothetical protein
MNFTDALIVYARRTEEESKIWNLLGNTSFCLAGIILGTEDGKKK